MLLQLFFVVIFSLVIDGDYLLCFYCLKYFLTLAGYKVASDLSFGFRLERLIELTLTVSADIVHNSGKILDFGDARVFQYSSL